LTDRSPEQRRVAALRESLDGNGLEGAVIAWAAHVRYLTGIDLDWAPVFAVVDRDRVAAVVPEGAGIESTPDVEITTYVSGPLYSPAVSRPAALASLSGVLLTGGVKPDRLGVERAHLTLSDLETAPELGEATDTGPLLARQRLRKDEAEIAQIRANLRVVEAGFDAARELIRPGATELEVWAGMHAAMLAATGAPFTQDGRMASGPRTLGVEPHATNRRLEPGDIVYIDLFPVINGYSADLTRAFVVGEPSAAQRARHAVLEAALTAGGSALRPGARASDVDRAVRSVVADALDGYTYPHHTGHGFGLQPQEPPYLIPSDEMPLEPGMIVAVEPGIYLPDTRGMRLEGNYLITEDGCEALSDYPMELFACG
jgi:Xaa-Pro aminopeptidase